MDEHRSGQPGEPDLPAEHGSAPPADLGSVQAAAVAEPHADSEPQAAAPPDLLPHYLADRDVPCPHCGYNLRGTNGGTCPECGGRVELAVSGTSRLAGAGLFLLLAFAWVLLAAGMNAARNGHSIYADAKRAATMGPLTLFTSSTTTISVNGRTTVITRGGQPVINGNVVVTPAPGGGLRVRPGAAPGGSGSGGGGGGRAGVLGVPGVQGIGPGMVTLAPAGGAGAGGSFNWAVIGTDRWWLLGWWSGLALLGFLGLAVLGAVRLRKRDMGRRARRVLLWSAGLLFAGYAGYHVQLFAREAVTWW